MLLAESCTPGSSPCCSGSHLTHMWYRSGVFGKSRHILLRDAASFRRWSQIDYGSSFKFIQTTFQCKKQELKHKNYATIAILSIGVDLPSLHLALSHWADVDFLPKNCHFSLHILKNKEGGRSSNLTILLKWTPHTEQSNPSQLEQKPQHRLTVSVPVVPLPQPACFPFHNATYHHHSNMLHKYLPLSPSTWNQVIVYFLSLGFAVS